MQEMNSTVQHCIWADLTRWEGLGTLKCSSLFYVTNLPLLQIKTHCSVIRIYWIEPFSSNIFLHGSWLWERCIAWFLALREMYQVWFVIVRLHLKLRLNNSIFLVGVTSEGGKCLSAKVMFTTCRILNIPNGVDLGKSLVWAWKESNVASFNSCLHCIFVVEIHFQRCLKDGKRKAQMRGREAPNGRKGDACSLRGGK